MEHYDTIIVALLYLSLMFWEYVNGLYRRRKRSAGEWAVDFIAVPMLIAIKPAVLFLAFSLAAFLLPQVQGALADLPFWAAFLIVFLPDDLSHYWIHRIAHENRYIWGAHRTHHTATVYQTSISFRENWMWFWIMPGFWWGGFMVYLGLAEIVVVSTTIIGIHNVWLHSGFTWDRKLYRGPLTRRAWKAFEVLVNTPGLHRGHHGIGINGVPMGNYAQTLFIWDVLFGTAEFRDGALPEAYGTMDPASMTQAWYYHLWWPLFRARPNGQPSETSHLANRGA